MNTIPTSAPATRRPLRGVTLAVILLVAAGALGGWIRSTSASSAPVSPQATPTDTSARAPKGTRIRVRVVNVTTTRGLAKRATFVLRDFGYDVLEFEGAAKSKRTNTAIVSHTGHDDWGIRLRKALGVGAMETSSDSTHFVDFTVYVGRDWKAPAQPLRP